MPSGSIFAHYSWGELHDVMIIEFRRCARGDVKLLHRVWPPQIRCHDCKTRNKSCYTLIKVKSRNSKEYKIILSLLMFPLPSRPILNILER